jgi:benzoate-CoA ligase
VELALPDVFNAAAWFVDRNFHEGRGAKVAIECGDERVTYQQVFDRVNRVGNALREELGVRLEERVMLLLLDTPEFIYSFFGAMKIGAVPIPTSTLWKPVDYEYVLNDSRARVIIVSEQLLPHIQAIPPDRLRHVREIVVVGDPAEARETGPNRLRTRALRRVSPKPKAKAEGPAVRTLASLTADASGELEAEPTSKDDPAFWLYSSGSTGFPTGCVHLHHDMVVCTELYAKGVLGISADDRCFSVAKLFFAYGLGNAMFPPVSARRRFCGRLPLRRTCAVIESTGPTPSPVPTNYRSARAST